MRPLAAARLAALYSLCAACSNRSPEWRPVPPAADGQRLVVPMEIDGSLGEPDAIGPGASPSIRARVDRLHALQADADVVGVLLTIGSVEAGLAKIDDLTSALSAVRKSGRKVYCALGDAGNTEIYLAARACDHVAMAPASSLELTGAAADVVFFREALASIGVAADVVRSGAYKDAFEPATRDDMSPEMRESLGALVDDLYSTLVEGIAAGRGLPPEAVRGLVDRGLFSPEEAQAARLVDSVRHADSLRWLVRRDLRAKLASDGSRAQQAHADDVGRLVRSLAGEPRPPSPEVPHLGLVHVAGLIAPSGRGGGPLSDELASADAIVRALERMTRDPHTRAVVLRIDSPGGSASASERIWRAVHRLRARKPIVASMSDVAASGGYYVAAPATKILAQNGTVTGSIGVISAKVVAGELANRIGAHVEVIERGAMAGLHSPFRPWSPAERSAIERTTQSTYELFLQRVRTGRGRDLRAFAGGRVWSGRRAVTSGLVDQIGGLPEAMALARRLGHLPESCPVEVLPEPSTLFDRLLGRADLRAEAGSAQVAPTLAAFVALAPGALRRAAATLLLADRDRLLAVLPFSVRFR